MKAEPNSVWVSSDIDIDIEIRPGSVPRNTEELADFADNVRPALVAEGASWARYILFDENGDPSIEFDETFVEDAEKNS